MELGALRRSDHFDGRRFFNPNGANGQPFWMVARMLLTPRTRWPSEVTAEPRRQRGVPAERFRTAEVGESVSLA